VQNARVRRDLLVLGVGAGLGAAGVLIAIGLGAPSEMHSPADPSREPEPDTSPVAGRPSTPSPLGPMRFLVVGGGDGPASNQVSLEQDVALATRVLSGPGRILFAGGANSQGVQELTDADRGDPLMRELGTLLAPRAGRDAVYRPTDLRADGPFTRAALVDALTAGLGQPDPRPLLVYVAAHGDLGERARDNVLILWGGSTLSVSELAALLDESPAPRPLRLVITSCYSGGFAELVFEAADPARGPTRHDVCGVFASTWDDTASGCDPEPDRGAQEAYGLHLLHALAGLDRDGAPLPRDTLDLDRDGRISLLEAHTRVRIASESVDVPTTTSERWLRQVAPASGPERDVTLPEEAAVMAALGARLGVEGLGDATTRLNALEARLDAASGPLEVAEADSEDAAADLAAALLARWPVLDDPWHPDFHATWTGHREAIVRFVERAPEAVAWREAEAELERRADVYDALSIEAVPLRRYVRAQETVTFARRLAATGGPSWARYERFLACERESP